MRARLGMCAAVLVVAALGSSGTSSGSGPSSVGTIAYESQSTVYIADAAGGTARSLLNPAYAPSWSPDGTKLAIDTGSDLETINADGTHRVVLVSGAGLLDPAWSPDGTKIAYADTNQSGIWVVPAVGGTPTRLSSAGVETSPTWSPDGSQIGFLESDITANPPNIWIMNSDGSNQHKLTTVDIPDPGGNNLRNLAWSPDGTKLLYSTGAEPEVYGAGARSASIGVVDTSGSNEHILVAAPAHSAFTDPSWSPDGTSIIFSDTNLSGPVDTIQGLDIANADGSGRRSLLMTVGSYPIDTAQWIAGVPGAPTSVSAAAGDGRVAVSFGAPATNGGAAITSYTVTATPGGATATGSSSPLTVTGLTDGMSYTLSVVAANKIGSGAAAIVSATPVASGGGGGGGGGGGPAPDIAATLTASPTSPDIGGTLTYTLSASVVTGVAVDVIATINLPIQVVLFSATVNRGSGCTGTTTLTCNLDFLDGGLVATVQIVTRVSAGGALVASASLGTIPGDGNTANNSASVTTSVAVPTTPPPPPAPTTHSPALTRVGAQVIRGARHGAIESIAAAFSANRPMRISMSITPLGGTRRLTLLKGSRLGTAITRSPRFVESTVTTTNSETVALRALLVQNGIVKGKLYVIRLTGTASTGRTTTLRIPFKG